ncbi:hypothetical protein ON010_g17491 [Phytophthora cinnamomi]|nr:hypothetical protein ON010_g17491 [Phytophthora cinnamomi]
MPAAGFASVAATSLAGVPGILASSWSIVACTTPSPVATPSVAARARAPRNPPSAGPHSTRLGATPATPLPLSCPFLRVWQPYSFRGSPRVPPAAKVAVLPGLGLASNKTGDLTLAGRFPSRCRCLPAKLTLPWRSPTPSLLASTHSRGRSARVAHSKSTPCRSAARLPVVVAVVSAATRGSGHGSGAGPHAWRARDVPWLPLLPRGLASTFSALAGRFTFWSPPV